MAFPVYDLHTHSYCSDGQLSPEALVQKAAQQGVSVLALTDHDTIAGVAKAQQAACDYDLTLVPGIEFSCLWNGRNIHIVGLNIDTSNHQLLAGVEKQQVARSQRAHQIAQRLEAKGIKGAYDGAKHYAAKGAIGRPHFAQYMVDAGYSSSMAQAFKLYLGTGKVGDVKQCWPSMKTAIDWITAAGGDAVLAHPDKYDLTRTKLYDLVREFVDGGGRAIEVINGVQDAGVTDKLTRVVKDFALKASLGSDFHREGQPWQDLGCCPKLPPECSPVWESWSLDPV